MYLDYSKLEFDKDGNPEMPELMLQTLSGKAVGTIPGVHNLTFNIKYSELSEISFDVPAKLDGVDNPIYDDLSGYKLIYTKHYGIYEIINPQTESDGLEEIKHVTGYSLEKTLESKKFFLEEGTFNFWNPASPTDTVLGRLLEIAIGWSVGYVSPSLIGKYRTFDSYDDYLLSFVYNNAPEKYRCVFVFDTYERTINVYDADEEIANLPIYLDFDNLLETIEVTEKSDELVTAIRPYGADELDIRAVNPIGTNWIYDLSYFIANGDISGDLAEKWTAWQQSVLNNQAYYKGLVALQASTNARLLSEQAALTDLNGELATLISQQSVTIQTLATESTDAGKESQQAVLDDINAKIAVKETQIADEQAVIDGLQEDAESYATEIQTVVGELAIRNYFTDSEYEELSNFMIEQDITEDTFVASTVDASVSGNSYTLADADISVSGSSILMVDLTSKFSKKMYVMSGGSFAVTGDMDLSGDIVRGTLETKADGGFVMSFYAGAITAGEHTASSGLVTITGSYSGLASDVAAVTVDEITTYEGSSLSFDAPSGSLFLTANVSEYQQYSVQMELYDYAVGVLSDLATPTYEFEVDSGNFLFAQEFAPFRNELELGKGVYLNLGGEVITPYIIEMELDFEERNSFSLIFANTFKRPDETNTLKDMIETSYSTSRSFDASKYIYNQATSQTSAVSQYLSGSLDAAKNAVLAGSGTVSLDGTGLTIGVGSQYQIRMVDNMIAMTDDNWEHAKVGIGLVATPDGGSNFIVNAEVIGGKLIVGNNLVIENETDNGVMQFKVDATGAWLYNATFILQSDTVASYSSRVASTGGCIILDPRYGIAAGNSSLFTTSGTTVTPSFIDEDGDIILDEDDMPKNSNFYLDIRDGSAYFRGTLQATAGEIGGFTIEDGYLHTGSGSNYVAINGSGTNDNSAYAIWAGATSPSSAKFYVKKDGTLYAKDGTFRGTVYAMSGEFNGVVKATDFMLPSGDSMTSILNESGQISSDWLDLMGINVKNSAGVTVMTISQDGIVFGAGYSPIKTRYSTNQSATVPSGWSETWNSSWTGSTSTQVWAIYSYDGGVTWTSPMLVQGKDGAKGATGSSANVTFANILSALQKAASTQSTFITADSVGAPTIYGAKIYGAEMYAGGVNEEGSRVITMDSTGAWIYYNGKKCMELSGVYQGGYWGLIRSTIGLELSAPTVIFSGDYVDFTGVTVEGITATARFG